MNGHKDEGRDRREPQAGGGRRSQVSRFRSKTRVNMEGHKDPGIRSQIPRSKMEKVTFSTVDGHKEQGFAGQGHKSDGQNLFS